MNFWGTQQGLTVAAIALSVAFVIGLIMLIRPAVKVPVARRRMGAAPETTGLSRVADAATGGVDKALSHWNSDLDERLDLAGIKMPARDLVVIVASAAVAALALGLILANLLVGLLLAGLVVLAAIATVVLRTSRRRAAFNEQLDETTQLLAGSLRAGYSLGQAVSTVSQEAESPTKDEFIRIANELRLGRTMGDSMTAVALRMRSDDFEWLGQAVAINREVGGNLADVLDGVGHTLRERAELRRRVAALSAEGKLSAYVLIGLPFVVGGFVALTNPGYFAPMIENPIGWVMFGVALVMLVLGALWLRSMVRIKY